MFVVHSEPPFGERPFEKPFKAFSDRRSASAYARSQVEGDAERANVYEVEKVDNARQAVEALKMGAGTLVEPHSAQVTPEELRRRFDRDLRASLGGDKEAVSRVVAQLDLDF